MTSNFCTHRIKGMTGMILSLVMTAFPLIAGTPGYYYQELLYHFGGADSVLVNTRSTTGEDIGNQSKPYGLVTDPEGKRWAGFYSGYSNAYARGEDDMIRLAGIRCFLPDGTEAAFSPLEFLEFEDGSKDTLYLESPYNGNCRGISLDADGNILYTARSTLYKIDYRDGSGIARWHPGMDDKPVRTFVKAAHDPVSGYIYFAPYPMAEPLHILDEDLNFIDEAIPYTPTLQNAILARTTTLGVTQLFSATHANGIGIIVYESAEPGTEPFLPADTLGNYSEETDSNTIFYKAWPSSLDWIDRDEGIVIFGNDYRAITTVSSGTPPPSPHASRWVILDVDNDSMIAMFGAPWGDENNRPKPVAASVPENYLENQAMVLRPSGAQMLTSGSGPERIVISDFELNCVQSVVFSTTALDGDPYVPLGFTLYQNYPNPFNPLTAIRFHLERGEQISLDIRDLSGRKVSGVFSGYLEAGTHQVLVEASDLPSGVYLYSLSMPGFSVSRKMTLIK